MSIRAIKIHRANLKRSVHNRDKRDLRSVRAEGRASIRSRVVGKFGHVCSIRIHDEHLLRTRLIRLKTDLLPIRGERWGFVVGRIVRLSRLV